MANCSRLLIAPFDDMIFSKYHIYDNIDIDSHSTFDAGITYQVEDEVKYLDRVFKSPKADNIGNYPVPNTNTLSWVDIGATNEKLYLDGKRSNKSVKIREEDVNGNPIPLVIEYEADGIGYITIAGLEGESCTIELINTTDLSVISTETIQLGEQWLIMNDYDLLYPYDTILGHTKYFKDVPIKYGQKLKITIIPNAEKSAIGLLNFGRYSDTGIVLWGARMEASPSETVTRDVYDNVSTTPRNGVIRMTIPIGIEETNPNESQLNIIKNKLFKFRGVPITVIGEGIEGLSIFGLYIDVVIGMDSAYYNKCELVIDSLE